MACGPAAPGAATWGVEVIDDAVAAATALPPSATHAIRLDRFFPPPKIARGTVDTLKTYHYLYCSSTYTVRSKHLRAPSSPALAMQLGRDRRPSGAPWKMPPCGHPSSAPLVIAGECVLWILRTGTAHRHQNATRTSTMFAAPSAGAPESGTTRHADLANSSSSGSTSTGASRAESSVPTP